MNLANRWNTETSSTTPPHVPHGYAQPPTILVASRKVSQTTVWNLPTLYSLFFSPRYPNTNDLPTHVLSAATIPKKTDPYRTCITIGGNLIDYPGNLSMKVADMTTFKILVNSTLSSPGACWLGLDVQNNYLGTPMEDYEYMFIPITSIPPKSSHTTNSKTLSTTAKSTWRYVTECTVFPRPASWPKNN